MRKASQGFTLVELAIVMVIIGLLIGGILKGGELIASAKVNKTISMINGYNGALQTYLGKYNAIPGDHLTATIQVPNCNNPAYFCANGDGNRVIASAGFGADPYNWQSRMALNADPISQEATQLWKHLALADIISGIETNANPTEPEWGRTHPASPLGGGFEIYYDGRTTIGGGAGGSVGSINVLRLSRTGIYSGAWENLLTPRDAGMLDRKMDDGAPNTGYVVMNYGSTTDRCKVNVSGSVTYNEDLDEPACTLFYVLPR